MFNYFMRPKKTPVFYWILLFFIALSYSKGLSQCSLGVPAPTSNYALRKCFSPASFTVNFNQGAPVGDGVRIFTQPSPPAPLNYSALTEYNFGGSGLTLFTALNTIVTTPAIDAPVSGFAKLFNSGFSSTATTFSERKTSGAFPTSHFFLAGVTSGAPVKFSMYSLPLQSEAFFLEFDIYFHSPDSANTANSWRLDIGQSSPSNYFETVGGSSSSSFAQIIFEPHSSFTRVLAATQSFDVNYNQIHKFQIYCNLKNVPIIFSRAGKHYRINANSFQIWINNNYIASFDNILRKDPISSINAFAFNSPTGQLSLEYFNISIDNAKYGAFPFQEIIQELNGDPTSSFNINLNTTTTFYAEQFVSNANPSCGASKGVRQPLTLEVLSQPSAPTVPLSSLIICPGEPVVFSISGVASSTNGLALYKSDNVTLVNASDLQIAPPSPAYQLTLNNVTTTSTYYLKSVYTDTPPLMNAGGALHGGCSSPSASLHVTVKPAPAISSFSAPPICGPGNAVIAGSTSIGSGSVSQVKLYANATGGVALSSVAVDNLGNFTLSTPVIATNVTFYLEAISNLNCKSFPRTAVPITVNPKPAPPNISSLSVCPVLGGATATFTATPADGFTNQIALYSDPLATSLLQSDNVPPYELTVSGALTSATYYARAENTNTGCKSNIIQAQLNILPAPNPPLSGSASRCGAGPVIVTITPNNVNGGNLMRLYSVPSGGAPIGQNAFSPYTIPVNVGVGTSTFYAEAVFGATGCTHLPNNGNNRVPIIVTGIPTPLPPVITPDSIALCNSGQATFSITIAPPAQRIRFFNAAAGGAPQQIVNASYFVFTSGTLNATLVRFVDAVDTATGCPSPTRTRLKAEIVPKPATPSGVGSLVRCSPGNVEFPLPSVAGAVEFRLYQTANAQSPIAVYPANATAVITNLSVSSTYYLASANSVCESVGRLPIPITVHNNPDLQVSDLLPVSPLCGSGQAAIAINPNAPALSQTHTPKSLRLYTTPSGGNPIAAQNFAPWQVSTPNISVSTTFYLEIFDFSLGCATSRVPAAVTVNPRPAAPILGASVSRCGAGPVTVSLTPGAGGDNIRWYAAANGGAPISTGVTLNLANVTQTQTVYAASLNSGTGCETEQRLAVALTIHPIPPQPSAQSLEIKRCGVGPVKLTAALSSGNEIRWYNGALAAPSLSDSPASVTQSPSIHQFILLNVASNTSVTAAAVNTSTGCISLGRIFNISFLPPISAPPAETLSVCGGVNAPLTVNYPFQNNYSLRLYNAQAGGALISSASANPYQFNINVSINTTYWLSAFESQSGCESERSPWVIDFTPVPSLGNIRPATTDLCQAGSPVFEGALSPGLELQLYTQASGGTPISVAQASASNLSAPLITTHTTFFLSIANITVSPACSSPRRSFAFRVNSILPEPGNAAGLTVRRCATGNFSFALQVSSPQINRVRIYDAPQGGNLIQTLGPPFIFNAGNLGASATFYAESFNTATGCTSLSRIPLVAQINSFIAPPTVLNGNLTRCGAGNITLSIVVDDSSQTGIRVYSAASGNNLLQTFSRASSRLTINVSATTTLYLASYSLQDPSCESERVAVPVSILQSAPIPSWPSQLVYCGDNLLTVPANFGSFSGTARVALWSSLNAQTPIASDENSPFELSVGALAPGQYWLSSLAEGGCESPRHSVFIRTGTRPSPVNPIAPITLCGSGRVDIKPSLPPNFEGQVNVYTQAWGGNAMLTLSPPLYEASVNVQATTTFYLEAITTPDCPSLPRTPFIVNVVPMELGQITDLPNEVGRCGQGSVQFSISGASLGAGAVLRLYTSTVGASISEASAAPYTLSVPFISTTTTFYVGLANPPYNCESARRPLVARVWPTPPRPIAAETSVCANRSVTLTLSLEGNGGSGLALYLYTQSTVQEPMSVISGVPFIFRTPSISTSTTYWAAASPGKGCESERVPISIQAASTGAASFTEEIVNAGCGQNRGLIKILPSTAGQWRFQLYTQSSGGAPIATVAAAPYHLQTPAISGPTTFYAAQLDPATGCESARRMVVVTQSEAIPSVPLAQNQTFCLSQGDFSISLSAQMGSIAGREIRVYTTPSGGAPIATLDTPPYEIGLSPRLGVTTYYLSAAKGDCESPRTAVIATVNAAPSKPSIKIQSSCGPGNASLALSLDRLSGQNVGVRLYTSEQSVSPLLSDFTLPFEFALNITTSVTYFVAAELENGGCASERVAVPLLVTPPAPPAVRNVVRNNCGPTDFDIQLDYAFGAEALELYAQPSGGAPIKTFSPPVEVIKTDVLQANTTLFLAQKIGGCLSPRVAINLNLQNGPRLRLLGVTRESCGGLGSIRVVASEGSGNYTYRLSNGQTNTSGVFENLPIGRYSVFLEDPEFPACTSKIDNIEIEPSAIGTLLTPVMIEDESALLQWNPIPGAQGFRLGYRKVGSVGPYQLSPTLSSSEFQFRFTDLEPETEYEAVLFATCFQDRQLPTAKVTFRTLPLAKEGFCSIPVNLRVTPISSTSVELRWSPNEGSARCYILMVGPLDTPRQDWPRYTVAHPNYKFLVENLTPGRRYGFAIATNCTECEPSSGIRTPYSPTVIFTSAANKDKLDIEPSEALSLSLYPNPNNGVFELDIQNAFAQELILSVLDLQGKTIWQEQRIANGNSLKETIALERLSAGVYVLEVQSGQERQRVKFIRR